MHSTVIAVSWTQLNHYVHAHVHVCAYLKCKNLRVNYFDSTFQTTVKCSQSPPSSQNLCLQHWYTSWREAGMDGGREGGGKVAEGEGEKERRREGEREGGREGEREGEMQVENHGMGNGGKKWRKENECRKKLDVCTAHVIYMYFVCHCHSCHTLPQNNHRS